MPHCRNNWLVAGDKRNRTEKNDRRLKLPFTTPDIFDILYILYIINPEMPE